MDSNSLGRWIQWARRRAGMTQQDLARALDMPQPSIARIERGRVVPRTATLFEILRATGMDLAFEAALSVDEKPIRRRLAMTVPRRTRLALGKAANPRTSPVGILKRLRRFGVPFVLIGGLAEVAHGSPAAINNKIEICHASTDVALERLAHATDDLGAKATARLELVTQTAAGDAYDVLAQNAVRMHVDAGILVRVAALQDLIRIRRAGCSSEDRDAVAMLSIIADAVAQPSHAVPTSSP